MSIHNGSAEGFAFGTGILISFVATSMLCISVDTASTKTHDTIIEHGCAQFNPKTAEFEWLDTLSVPKDGVSTCTP